MKSSMRFLDIMMAVVVTFVWGLHLVVMKWGMAEIPPMLYVALRFVVSALLFIPFVPKPSVKWRYILGTSLCIGILHFAFLFLALKLGLSAGLTAILLQTQVFWSIFLCLALYGIKPTRLQLLGVITAFVGITVIGFDNLSGSLWGFVSVLVAAFAFAAGNIVQAAAKGAEPIRMAVWFGLAPIPVMLLASYLFEGGIEGWKAVAQHMTWRGGIAVAYSGLIATIVGSSLWVHLLTRHGATHVTPYALLIPVFGMLTGVLILDEEFTRTCLLGSALVFTGLVINQLTGERMRFLRALPRRLKAALPAE